MANKRVLSDEILAGFDKYKYNAVDTSPLSNYVMHPFWNWCVKLVPMWVAPNVLTLTGFLLLVFNFLVMIYYDLDFYGASLDHPEFPPVPNWVWLLCAFNNFMSHTLDGIDGKQARRTGTSSPLGELFDHGLDSWASFFLPVAMYSVYGRGEYGADTYSVYLVLLGVNFCFIASHWEKYNTGILFLPWGYDLSQIGMTAVYLITFFCGYEVWKFSVFGMTTGNIFIIVMWVALAISIPITLWNIYIGYHNKTGKMLSLQESVRPLVSTVLLFALMITWSRYSSYDIINRHTRIFYTTTGTVFSNIACRLIIAQMSNTRCELVNRLLIPLFTIVMVTCLLNLGVLEFYILTGYCIYVLASHIHFGFCVVEEMCDHFKIKALSIPPKKGY
ncbi:ethanolaminephosphotransferase 1-like isoform X2 [Mya arenaria]|uniref:ethanolaminephosphotransferase 1-like isoform X2 n=1 Tax=Mya arenaria TaxID=6604 RepID=UPI0022E7EB66|nr:ethanolaminephosphotransferase 1-like isoform X2 [Mya arenaria]